jgi:hypothetical protein
VESHLPVRHNGELKAFRLDEVDPTLIYLGYARVGALTSAAEWQIKKLTLGPGESVVAEWADGNVEFDNVWDNRASLSYS